MNINVFAVISGIGLRILAQIHAAKVSVDIADTVEIAATPFVFVYTSIRD